MQVLKFNHSIKFDTRKVFAGVLWSKNMPSNVAMAMCYSALKNGGIFH